MLCRRFAGFFASRHVNPPRTGRGRREARLFLGAGPRPSLRGRRSDLVFLRLNAFILFQAASVNTEGGAWQQKLGALTSLLDLETGDRARDHEPLNLRGTLEDRVDLGVAVHPLNRVLARIAVPPEDLDRALGD